MRFLTYRMAEICDVQRVSTLGAEAVAAAEHLNASLWVWEGDDGPAIRSAAAASGVRYVTIARLPSSLPVAQSAPRRARVGAPSVATAGAY